MWLQFEFGHIETARPSRRPRGAGLDRPLDPDRRPHRGLDLLAVVLEVPRQETDLGLGQRDPVRRHRAGHVVLRRAAVDPHGRVSGRPRPWPPHARAAAIAGRILSSGKKVEILILPYDGKAYKSFMRDATHKSTACPPLHTFYLPP